MSIILPIVTDKGWRKLFVIFHGTLIFCSLGLIVVPALVHADERDRDHMVMRLKNLEDNDSYIRRCAAIDIGLYDRESKDNERKEIITALKRHLLDADKLVRYSAAEALVDIDTTSSKQVLPILIEKLNDKTVNPITAALSLRNFGPEAKDAVPIIIDLMNKEGISWFWGYPHSEYGDVLRDIGTPEALTAVEPLKQREWLASAFYAPFGLLLLPMVSLLISLCFAGFFWWSRAQYKKGEKIKYMPLLIPALSWGCWGLYVVNDERLNSFGGAIFIFCWFLFFATLAGVIPWLVSWLRVRAQEKRDAAGSPSS
ncbi:MAG: HEAT repeat domain-containing protein [Elusimicrobia bacterium]|nr:HEAT repeat domain-containing protein [Elusimicrobiota bacterium]